MVKHKAVCVCLCFYTSFYFSLVKNWIFLYMAFFVKKLIENEKKHLRYDPNVGQRGPWAPWAPKWVSVQGFLDSVWIPV